MPATTDVRISELEPAEAAHADDRLETSQVTSAGFVSKSLTLDQVATFVAASDQIGDLVDDVPGGSTTVAIGDAAPFVPSAGDLWWDSTVGALFIWYADTDSEQWVKASPASTIIEGEGGGGSGDDLDTTPVAPTGSAEARVMPDWLAGAPVVECPEDVLVSSDHRGVWLHMMSDIGSTIYLPDDWLPGMAFGARQIGVGLVQWVITGGADLQLPFTKASHSGISEQYEDVIFRVITNTDGSSAVWGVSGGTA